MTGSSSSYQRKAYKDLARKVLLRTYEDARRGGRFKNEALRFIKSRTCLLFCDLAGINPKAFRNTVARVASDR